MNKKNSNGCKFLRAKNAYGTMEGGDNPLLPLDEGTTQYWCLKTCSPVGSDNLPVYTKACHKNRLCFEPMAEIDSDEEYITAV